MSRSSALLVTFQLLVIIFTIAHSVQYYNGLINSRVQSATYLTSAVTKFLVTVEVKNIGNKLTDIYFLTIPKSLSSNIAYIHVIDSDSGTNLAVKAIENTLDIHQSITEQISVTFDNPSTDALFYEVSLPYSLYPRKKGTKKNGDKSDIQLKITLGLVHLLSPLPKQIKKHGKQYMTYNGNKYWYSPYPTSKLGVKFTLASNKIKSSTKDASSVDGKKLGYGPFTSLNALSIADIYFHFEFPVPFLTMTEVVRDIEVSHWGNVRIEESFLLRHDGSQLKGAFEPGMMDRQSGGHFGSVDPASVRGLKAILPKGANNVAYVDRIGNISTSHFRSEKTRSILEMKPRYPLYGGWKTDFTIGYDVPAQYLISIDHQRYTLNVSFAIPFREPVTDSLVVRIALPEGAHDIKIHSPYSIDIVSDGGIEKRFTYLDSRFGGGRPLIIFRKQNVVHLHSKYFQVSYVYNNTRIFYKPLLIITGIFMFFASIMFLTRINPSLDDCSDGQMGDGIKGRYINDDIKVKCDVSYVELVMGIDANAFSALEIIEILGKAKKAADMEGDSEWKQKIKKAMKKSKEHISNHSRIQQIVSDLQSELSS